MKEAFLHYIYEYQLIENNEFKILSPGLKNVNAGPDFLNAKIEIGNMLWVGNVEIHINASDWKKHGHHKNKSYDNIILHLVLNKDVEVQNTKEQILKTYEIKFNPHIYNTYLRLIHSLNDIRCQEEILRIDSLIITQQIESLAIERLKRKSQHFKKLIEYNKKDVESAFYQALAIGFGGKINAVPFELIAKETPFKIFLKNRDKLQTIEAILLGQAGILDATKNTDNKEESMQNEYNFLRLKYSLVSIRYELLKYSKLRPYGFPDLKLAYFAKLIYNHHSLFQKFYECATIKEVESLLDIGASNFWDTHYRVGALSTYRKKKMGIEAKRHLIINIIIPFMYAYAELRNKKNQQIQYIEWLEMMKPEKNSITKKWEQIGAENINALCSQGLIELQKEKCKKYACLDCKIGHKILTLLWNK